MKPVISLLTNQDGSAIVIALLALAALTVIGLTSIDSSVTESSIVRNEQIYHQNFYQAEAAALEAAQRVSDETSIDNLRTGTGTTLPMIATSELDIWNATESEITSLTSGMSGGSSGMASSSAVVSSQAYFSANAKGIVSGASLDMTSDSNVYGFKIYGYSEDKNGNVLIVVGYKKRM